MHSIEDDNRYKGFSMNYRQGITAMRQSPHLLMGLLLVVVALAHLMVALWLLAPQTSPVKPKPVLITVSLLPAPAKPASAPAAAQPAPAPVSKPPQVSKPKPAKLKPKPKRVEKAPPKDRVIVKKAAPELQPKPVAEPVAAASPPQVAPAPVVAAKPAARPVPAAKPAASAKEILKATCISCPSPDYPAIARRRGWQGSVLLKFQLTPDGLARNIEIVRGSGHEMLDEAAIANAKESRFTTEESGVVRVATKLFNFKLN